MEDPFKDLVLLRTKLLKWSFFGPFITQKSFFFLLVYNRSFFGPFFLLKSLKCREMCNIVNMRFLRPFGVIMEITTKSPQKLYNGSFFGPFFLLKSPFFIPLKSFWPQVLKTRFHLRKHCQWIIWGTRRRLRCTRWVNSYPNFWLGIKMSTPAKKNSWRHQKTVSDNCNWLNNRCNEKQRLTCNYSP